MANDRIINEGAAGISSYELAGVGELHGIGALPQTQRAKPSYATSLREMCAKAGGKIVNGKCVVARAGSTPTTGKFPSGSTGTARKFFPLPTSSAGTGKKPGGYVPGISNTNRTPTFSTPGGPIQMWANEPSGGGGTASGGGGGGPVIQQSGGGGGDTGGGGGGGGSCPPPKQVNPDTGECEDPSLLSDPKVVGGIVLFLGVGAAALGYYLSKKAQAKSASK